MREKIGEELSGTITGIANHGFYTSLDSPFVDVLTPIEALGGEIEMDELGVRLFARRSGERWTLGDRLTVRIEDVSLERREVIALPVGEIEPAELFSDLAVSPKRERSSVPPSAKREGRRRRSDDGRPSGGRRSGRSEAKNKRRRRRR
jgi:ribonuclease R